MTIQRTTTNAYLATLAGVLNRAPVKSTEALEIVARSTAEEIAKQDPSVSADDLMKAVPDAWKSDPGSSYTRSQVQAFLQVAEPVLGVDVAALSPIVTRGMQTAKDSALAIAVNRAKIADPNTPAQTAVVDFTQTPLEVRDTLQALGKDKAFLAIMGGEKYESRLARLLQGEAANAAAAAAVGKEPESDLEGGGLEVFGSARVMGGREPREPKTFFSLATGKEPMDAARLGGALCELAIIRDGLSEQEWREAISGAPVNFGSGRVPHEALELEVRRTDAGVEIGFSVNLDELRDFHSTDDKAEDITQRVADTMKPVWERAGKLFEQGIPRAMAADRSSGAESLVDQGS
jgi:hypothetical protein